MLISLISDDYKDLVSIVLPVYNYGRFLKDALNSVLMQSYSNWECLIMDDGSTDDTKNIANPYCLNDSRFKYFYQENSGISKARNNSLAHCTGKFYAFLDADDIWNPDKLEQQINIFAENNPDIIFSAADRFDLSSDTHSIVSGNIKYSNPLDFIAANPIVPSSVIMKKEVVDSVGLFDETLQCIEDGDYWFRCSLAGMVFYFDKSVRIIKRNHKTNAMSNYLLMYNFHIVVLNKHLKLLHNSNYSFDKDNLFYALCKRIETIRWYARDLSRYDLILKTYLLGTRLAGLRYYFYEPTLKALMYDMIQLIRRTIK